MPATSEAQRRLMAIAEHDPGAVFPENKGVTKMSQSQLHDFAATKEKGLPHHARGGKHDQRKGGSGRFKRGRGRSMHDKG